MPREARRSQGCARDGSPGVVAVVAAAPRHRGRAVRFVSCPLVRGVPATRAGGGFAALGAVLRRVVGVSWLYWCNSPVGDGVGATGGTPARPRAQPPAPGSQLPAHAPAARPGPQAQPGPPHVICLATQAARPGPQAARPAQLSASFQAFARDGSQPLHLGALICQRPLDAGVRHAQTPPLNCDAQYNSSG